MTPILRWVVVHNVNFFLVISCSFSFSWFLFFLPWTMKRCYEMEVSASENRAKDAQDEKDISTDF